VTLLRRHSSQDGNNCVSPPTLRSSPGGAAGGLTTKPPIYILDYSHHKVQMVLRTSDRQKVKRRNA